MRSTFHISHDNARGKVDLTANRSLRREMDPRLNFILWEGPARLDLRRYGLMPSSDKVPAWSILLFGDRSDIVGIRFASAGLDFLRNPATTRKRSEETNGQKIQLQHQHQRH